MVPQLPIEVVRHVLDHVESFHDLLALSQVCSRWRWLIEYDDSRLFSGKAFSMNSAIYTEIRPGHGRVSSSLGPWLNACLIYRAKMHSRRLNLKISEADAKLPYDEIPDSFGETHLAISRHLQVEDLKMWGRLVYTKATDNASEIIVIDSKQKSIQKHRSWDLTTREVDSEGEMYITMHPIRGEKKVFPLKLDGDAKLCNDNVVVVNALNPFRSRVIVSDQFGPLCVEEAGIKPSEVFHYGPGFLLARHGVELVVYLETKTHLRMYDWKSLNLDQYSSEDRIAASETHIVYFSARKQSLILLPLADLVEENSIRVLQHGQHVVNLENLSVCDAHMEVSERYVAVMWTEKPYKARLLLYDLILHEVKLYEHEHSHAVGALVDDGTWIVNWEGKTVFFTSEFLESLSIQGATMRS